MKAAASFKPHEVVYDSRVHKMTQLSWEHFERLVRSPESAKAGIRKHIHWEAASLPKSPAGYLSVMDDFQTHERPNVPGGYSYGWRYRTFFIDTPIYIPWLERRFKEAGGQVIELSQRFSDLDELRDLPADVVFNCTGLGARELAKDSQVKSLKGQIVLIDRIPEMDWSISADGFYVYPRSNNTVLGGTVEPEVENEEVENGAIHLILRGNKRILPNLSIGDVRGFYAGLRPFREGSVRVEAEEIDNQKIIHNYGHGGSGITLSWGSAQQALELI